MLWGVSSRPNVLVLLADEWRADTLACYGNAHVQAPHVNRFAEEACVFEQAYCNQAVCTPSRATIWTGVYPHTHQCIKNNEPLPTAWPTLAEMAPAEYHCAYYGKWHLGNEIVAQRGWKEWRSVEDGIYRPYYSDPTLFERCSDYHEFLIQQGFAPDDRAEDGAAVFSRGFTAAMAAQYTKAGYLGREAEAFLRRQEKNAPWFLTVSFLEPHMPFWGPYNDRHDPAGAPVGEAFNRDPEATAPRRLRERSAKYRAQGYDGMPLGNETQWRRMLANYHGLVSLIDEAMGRILGALEETGQAENTLVAVTSDHGDMMGDHACLAKDLEYEPSARVPLLIRAPWEKSARRASGPVSLVDIAPTILDYMGAPAPKHLQGVSRRGLVEQGGRSGDDVFIEWHGAHPYRVIVSPEGWKLTVAPDDRSTLFYLPEDPAELRNRYAETESRAVVRDLRARLARWAERTGDAPEVAGWDGV